jgi:hypothetical protein
MYTFNKLFKCHVSRKFIHRLSSSRVDGKTGRQSEREREREEEGRERERERERDRRQTDKRKFIGAIL